MTSCHGYIMRMNLVGDDLKYRPLLSARKQQGLQHV